VKCGFIGSNFDFATHVFQKGHRRRPGERPRFARLRTGPHRAIPILLACYPPSRLTPPRSGPERNDFVLWRILPYRLRPLSDVVRSYRADRVGQQRVEGSRSPHKQRSSQKGGKRTSSIRTQLCGVVAKPQSFNRGGGSKIVLFCALHATPMARFEAQPALFHSKFVAYAEADKEE
jgi:hypothetical protein